MCPRGSRICPESLAHLVGAAPSPQAHVVAVLTGVRVGHVDGALVSQTWCRSGRKSCQYTLYGSLNLSGHIEIQTLGYQIPKSLHHSIGIVTPAGAGGPKEAPSLLQLEGSPRVTSCSSPSATGSRNLVLAPPEGALDWGWPPSYPCPKQTRLINKGHN